jgi:hypothetical protein
MIRCFQEDMCGQRYLQSQLLLVFHHPATCAPSQHQLDRLFYMTGDLTEEGLLFDTNDNVIGHYGNVKRVSVPEPATMLLLGLGLIGLAGIRRKMYK